MMGFKPGDALGKQPSREDKPFGARDEEHQDADDGISAPLQQPEEAPRRGIGSGGGGFARASFVSAGGGGGSSSFSPLPAAPTPPPNPVRDKEKEREKPRTEPIKFEMRTGAFPLRPPFPLLFPAAVQRHDDH